MDKPDPATDSYGFMVWTLWEIVNMRFSDPEEMRKLALEALDSAGQCGA